MAGTNVGGWSCLPFPSVPPEQRRLLIVDGDPDIAKLLRANLRGESFDVAHAGNGHAGLRHIKHGVCDLVVLDFMLPGIDGFEICRRVRARSEYTPIIIVSAKSDETHRILGLELGADDYLTKPVSVLELVARIRSLFRRIDHINHAPSPQPSLLLVGELQIDVAARDVRVSGRPVTLTRREFELLHFLARHRGRVFTRPELLNHVWGYDHDGYEHTVNSHINRLRSKIEPDPANPSYIVTVWGVGYKFGDRRLGRPV